MANMQPFEIPAGRETTRSEGVLFEALRDGLSDEFWVYHSLPFVEPERGLQGEADFIVLHRQLGMLVLECKGNGVRRRADGVWVREFRGKERKLGQSPAEQAAGQLRSLLGKFHRPLHRAFPTFHGTWPLVYGWALAFPFTRWDREQLPTDFEPELLLDCDALNDMEPAIRSAFAFYRRRYDQKAPPELSEEDFERLRLQVISPEVDLAPNLAGAIEVERNRMVRLTQDQARVVRLFMSNKRLCVRGAAGTGKTVLAQHGASLLAREGKEVMLVCFNRNLRDDLRESVKLLPEGPGSIYVTNFHALCSRAHFLLYDAPMNVPDGEAATEFWVEEAPSFLLEALERELIAGWDAIVVDEGQDFAAPWWPVLERALRDEDAQLAVFYDEAQSIFAHGCEVPDYPTVIPLVENFRNTRRIAEAITVLGVAEMRSHARCPDGDVPSVFQQPEPDSTRAQIADLLTDLIESHRLRPNQIVIITPRTPANSSLGHVRELNGIPIVHSTSERSRGVLHATISAFKGLEADTVILADIDPDEIRCDVNSRYVAASRACHRLYIFQKSDWQAA